MKPVKTVRTHLGDFIRSEFTTGGSVVERHREKLQLTWNGNQFRAIWNGGRTFDQPDKKTQVTRADLIPSYVAGLMRLESTRWKTERSRNEALRVSAILMAHEPKSPEDSEFPPEDVSSVVEAWMKVHPELCELYEGHELYFDATRFEGPWGVPMVPPSCFLTACRVFSDMQAVPGGDGPTEALLFCHRLTPELIAGGKRSIDGRSFKDLKLSHSPTVTWKDASDPDRCVMTFEAGGVSREIVVVPLDRALLPYADDLGFKPSADVDLAAKRAHVHSGMGWQATSDRMNIEHLATPALKGHGGLTLLTGATGIGKTHSAIHLFQKQKFQVQQVSAASGETDTASLLDRVARVRLRPAFQRSAWARAAVVGPGSVVRLRSAVVLDDLDALPRDEQPQALQAAAWLALGGTHAILAMCAPTEVSVTSPELYLRAQKFRETLRSKDREPPEALLTALHEALGFHRRAETERFVGELKLYATSWALPVPALSEVLDAILKRIEGPLCKVSTGLDLGELAAHPAERSTYDRARSAVRLGLRRSMPHQMTRGLIPRALLPGAVRRLINALEQGLDPDDNTSRPRDADAWEQWAEDRLPFERVQNQGHAEYLLELTTLALPHLRRQPSFQAPGTVRAGAGEVLRLAFIRHSLDPAIAPLEALRASNLYTDPKGAAEAAEEVRLFLDSLSDDELRLLATAFFRLVLDRRLALGAPFPTALVVPTTASIEGWASRWLDADVAEGPARDQLETLQRVSDTIEQQRPLDLSRLRGLSLSAHPDAPPPRLLLAGAVRALRITGREVILVADGALGLKAARVVASDVRLAADGDRASVTLSAGRCDANLHVGSGVTLVLDDDVELLGTVGLSNDRARVVVEAARLSPAAVQSLAQAAKGTVDDHHGLFGDLTVESRGHDVELSSVPSAKVSAALAEYGVEVDGVRLVQAEP